MPPMGASNLVKEKICVLKCASIPAVVFALEITLLILKFVFRRYILLKLFIHYTVFQMRYSV